MAWSYRFDMLPNTSTICQQKSGAKKIKMLVAN